MPGGVPDLTPRHDLNISPKTNWVEDRGGLPRYIESVASALVDQGMTRQRAIAVAVNTVKKWCATGRAHNLASNPPLSPAVRSAACAAVAHWEAMKGSK